MRPDRDLAQGDACVTGRHLAVPQHLEAAFGQGMGTARVSSALRKTPPLRVTARQAVLVAQALGGRHEVGDGAVEAGRHQLWTRVLEDVGHDLGDHRRDVPPQVPSGSSVTPNA